MDKNDCTQLDEPNNLHIVTVIVPTYRRDLDLEHALTSLVNQTYKNIEIVVVDDNGDDMWNKKVKYIIGIINQLYNVNIVYVKNSSNQGSAETRNAGIWASSGAYVTFLDDDDIYLPNKVGNQLKHMMQGGSEYSITDLYLYDENDKLIEKRDRRYIKSYRKEDLLRCHLMHHMTGTDTMMFKREYLISLGGFPSIDIGDEFYLMQKAIEGGGRFSYLPRCDVRARVHSYTEGLSSGDAKIRGENELYDYKKSYFPILPRYSKRYISMRHYAVLAFAELRRRRYYHFVKYSARSFLSSPIDCIRLFFCRK